jgi:hypothetical protein
MTTGSSLTAPSERFRTEIQPAWEEYLSNPLVERKANSLASAVDHHLGPVGIWDSHAGLIVIQALDGPIRFD